MWAKNNKNNKLLINSVKVNIKNNYYTKLYTIKYKNFSFCFTFERFLPIILIVLWARVRKKEKEKKI